MIVVGIVSAVAASRLLSGLLYEVGRTDLATFVVVALVVASTTLLAGLVPARRAARTKPVAALQEE